MTKRLRRRRSAAPALHREAFPALTAFVRGYLHEDFPEVHGSLGGAARAFTRDATPDERQQLSEELESLLRSTSGHTPGEIQRFITAELGSRWEPGSREALAELRDLLRIAKD